MRNAEQTINRHTGLSGFTIAEILVAMVVLGLLGALTVPMLGKQKDKPWLKSKRVHGTVECYYYKNESNEYKLHMFVSDNQDNKNGQEIAEEGSDDKGNSNDGTTCYFKMPNANAVIVQAVGAGGDGGTPPNASSKPYYVSSPTAVNKYIPVDNHFLDTINDPNTPDWVREEWNLQWDNNRGSVNNTGRTVENMVYRVTSALGGGGNDVCKPELNHFEPGSQDEEDCKNCAVGSAFTDVELCPTKCTNKAGADGGNGAKGGVVDVTTKLFYSPAGPRDNVVFDTALKTAADTGEPIFGQVTLGFRPTKYVTLQPSSRGINAYLPDLMGDAVGRSDGDNDESFDGKIWDKDESYTYNGNVIGPQNLQYAGDLTVSNITNTTNYNPGRTKCGGNGVAAEQYTAGSIVVVSPKKGINYQTSALGIKGYFGLAGEPGTATRLYFENIPMGSEFRLTPAKTNSQSSRVQMKKGDNWIDVAVAASGANGEYRQGERIPVTTMEDFPFPRTYYPKSFQSRHSELSVAGGANYRSKLAELFNDTNPDFRFNPGRSGYGMYPLLARVSGSALHIINNMKTGNENLQPLEVPVAEYNAYSTCLDGTQPLKGNSYMTGYGMVKYCGNPTSETMKGTPGAVVISW